MHIFNVIFRRNPRKSWGGALKKPLKFLCALATLFCVLASPFDARAVTLNFQRPDGAITKIAMDTTKPTSPALAARVGDTTYYAAMARASVRTSGGLFTQINDQVYRIIGALPESKFAVTTTEMSANTTFDFNMSAMGTFTVDWGDGVIDEIIRTDTTDTTYSHTYTDAGVYTIRMGGLATGYSADEMTAAISFRDSATGENTNIAGISGSLGAIFPTIDGSTPDAANNGGQPRFSGTFSGCSNLTGTIPAGLFDGISGQPASYMFSNTFYDCSNLSGTIPAGLFGNLSGTPAHSMFFSTFQGCSNLTGSIPAGLFGNISGAPAPLMFAHTFFNCNNLSGNIPAGLFGNLSGAPAHSMFWSTFYRCSNLTGSIPAGLFGNLSGAPADNMFVGTFQGCSKMSGPTARMSNGTRLYDVMYNGYTWYAWYEEMYPNTFKNMYKDSGIADLVADKFIITTTKMSANTTFSFNMSAIGDFVVDWGDGTVDEIVRTDTTDTTYSHTYTTAGTYNIGFSGTATGYRTGIDSMNMIDDTIYPVIGFAYNKNIAAIDGSLGAIFPTIGSGGDGRQPMFVGTFSDCSNLTGEIPSNLFAGVSGQPVYAMFFQTFAGCSKLSGNIPSGLFSGLRGAPADGMFAGTFQGCSNLTGNIPSELFGNLTGAPAEHMFSSTFSGCSNLTGGIPAKLFGNLSGAPAYNMFAGTFQGCRGLSGNIPSGLFGNLSGTPAEYMFSSTFSGCSGLSGSIPSGLFGDLSGAPAEEMFSSTFSGCSKLSGNIPSGLFGNLSGASEYNMFAGTFNGCSNLTGNIPSGLFGNLSGAAYGMFAGTFSGCSKLSGEIPLGLFGNPTGAPAYSMFERTFAGCSNMTGPTARDSYGTRLYDIVYKGKTWYEQKPSAFSDMYENTGIADPVFGVITKSMLANATFSFNMSAKGNFTVDWGDGTVDEIVRTNTTEKTYSHTYATAGVHIIGFDGTATGYSTSNSTAAISFESNTNVAGISGSLGAIFPTINGGSVNGTQPRFYSTFSDCTNLSGAIPAELFNGISGQPASGMFSYTFSGCSKLSGRIPNGLFGNLSGTPTEGMFAGTFSDCGGLTGSIPAGLFGNISGAPASYMFTGTFSDCRGLTGSIPTGLFGNLYGAPASYMFANTFYGCGGVGGLSARNTDGTRLYDVMYNGKTWLEQMPNAFTNMYWDTRVNTDN